ncbi:MAG TPA: hypothetical protein VGA20_10420 [Gemmatimonadales bacterium]
MPANQLDSAVALLPAAARRRGWWSPCDKRCSKLDFAPRWPGRSRSRRAYSFGSSSPEWVGKGGEGRVTYDVSGP